MFPGLGNGSNSYRRFGACEHTHTHTHTQAHNDVVFGKVLKGQNTVRLMEST